MPRLIPVTFTPEDFWRHAPAAALGDPDVCWRWCGSYWHGDAENYGLYKGHNAHRVAYFVYHDVQPGKLEVCHTCDHKWCVNPSHLFLGTNRDNALDMMAKGRHRFGSRPGVPSKKVDDDAVRDIRTSRESVPTLMRKYDLSEGWIHQIKSRKARTKVA